MLDVLSRDQIRELDEVATRVACVSGLVLMENAGRGAVDALLQARGDGPHRVAVLCGPGNNGGDGFVFARRLLTLGHEVRVLLAADPEKLAGDARANYKAWLGLGQEASRIAEVHDATLVEALQWCDVAVDALMGTGLTRNLDGLYLQLVDELNDASAYKVALDLPSGLDANTGQVLGAAIRADLTVTFAHRKLGLYGAGATDLVGKVVVADIGVPASLSDEVGISASVTESHDVRTLLKRRAASTHKGRAGRVLVVGGSSGKTGAAYLAARAALRAGAGLCTIACFQEAHAALEAKVVEVMTRALPEQDPLSAIQDLLVETDAVVVGPGLGLGAPARALVDHLVQQHPGLVIVDADALTHYAGRATELRSARGPRVLTPHPGEMARLLGRSVAAVEADRFHTLQTAVELTGASVLYKGERTICGTPGDLPCINPTGSPVLATGGAGDVLSGIVAAFACVMEPYEAAVCAAYVHGLAGEAWTERCRSDRGALATEIADAVPLVLAGVLT